MHTNTGFDNIIFATGHFHDGLHATTLSEIRASAGDGDDLFHDLHRHVPHRRRRELGIFCRLDQKQSGK